MNEQFLRSYFRQVYARGFGYRREQVDCCRFAADWVVFCGGQDPAKRWRGQYETECQALAFVEKAGGLVQILHEGMMSAGLTQTSKPRCGDVGCIMVRADRSVVGAICFDGLWWTISNVGVLPMPARHLRVWRVPQCQQS